MRRRCDWVEARRLPTRGDRHRKRRQNDTIGATKALSPVHTQDSHARLAPRSVQTPARFRQRAVGLAPSKTVPSAPIRRPPRIRWPPSLFAVRRRSARLPLFRHLGPTPVLPSFCRDKHCHTHAAYRVHGIRPISTLPPKTMGRRTLKAATAVMHALRFKSFG